MEAVRGGSSLKKAKGVRFVNLITGGISDSEFVRIPNPNLGNEQFPHPAGNEFSHRMTPTIPLIEAANQANAFRVGSPDCEIDALDSVHLTLVSSKSFIDLGMVAFTKQEQIQVEYSPHQYQ